MAVYMRKIVQYATLKRASGIVKTRLILPVNLATHQDIGRDNRQDYRQRHEQWSEYKEFGLKRHLAFQLLTRFLRKK
ncbi:hypothetical protein VIBNISFn27_130105 [Vibrio nigripulchritudo SFn27]|nr:hypothetical protein VIBNIMADA3021_920017 [Vibrio nigripulchritudo MADA3021]CCN87249.1 hypothetical protein VIBNISFn27_130105 [Vibrio nigripulchritudo SFn27]CCN94606.1 hypothetical protein VIBNIENn2_430105 [Vibrio nigripulchritudo ENn2]